MRVLVSNDDGIEAPGIAALAAALESLGEVWVVAPDREQSATSHSISLHAPLRIRAHGQRRFAVSGTPADAVYLAIHHVMADALPDVVVSGINMGPNLGNDVLYSGTVSAAMEGALFGFPALAFSLCMPEHAASRDAWHFDSAARVARELVVSAASRQMPPGVLLNVNVPNRPWDDLRGMKVCRLGYTDWADQVTMREDPRGKPYFWIGGARNGHDRILDSDTNAIAGGLVSITPIHYDVTDDRTFGYARGLAVGGLAVVADGLGDGPLAHPVHPRAR